MALARQVWRNFRELWRTQVFWTAVFAVMEALWQFVKGQFHGSIKDIAVPYVGIIALFLLVNVGGAIFRAEWKASKKRQHEEHRADRKAEIERSKPPVHEPNLKCRRIFDHHIWIGDDFNGHRHETVFMEIGNELSSGTVGSATDIKAHVTYMDTKDEQLQVRCPGCWTTHTDEVTILPGESRMLVVAIRKGTWMTDLYQGVPLKETVAVQVRLLSHDGQSLAEIKPFKLRFGANTYPALIKN